MESTSPKIPPIISGCKTLISLLTARQCLYVRNLRHLCNKLVTTCHQPKMHDLHQNVNRDDHINKEQVLYITVGATVESSVPLHYVHLSFSDDRFDNRK